LHIFFYLFWKKIFYASSEFLTSKNFFVVNLHFGFLHSVSRCIELVENECIAW